MASLIETAPEAGLAPLELGGLRLDVLPRLRVTSVAPFAGQAEVASQALRAMGLDFPAPNSAPSRGAARIVWTGRGQAFLMGSDPAPLAGLAALTDQSDGWARLRLSGAGADQALARLVPVDLRPASFAPGAALRALAARAGI